MTGEVHDAALAAWENEGRRAQQIEHVAIAMFEAENKIDGNEIMGWEGQPPLYKKRVRAMAEAAIRQLSVGGR